MKRKFNPSKSPPNTLENQMPDVYSELLRVGKLLESLYGDVYDIEFTIQEGQLFVLNTRTAKRTPRANLNFLIQFLCEGKIDIHEFILRVSFREIEDMCRPEICNLNSLISLGYGLPACSGAATGKIVFCSSDALRLSKQGQKVLLLKDEINPEDVNALYYSQGVLTTRGGMTSHASLICRGREKPCVVGLRKIQLNTNENTIAIPSHGFFRVGDWLTINGTTGEVYAGKGNIMIRNWRVHPELMALYQVIELSIKTNDVPNKSIGKVWKIYDFFIHNIPLRRSSTSKRPTERKKFVSFILPTPHTLDSTKESLIQIMHEEQDNYSIILLSMADTLSRLLCSALGLGNHHLYFRSLWDPRSTVSWPNELQGTQMIGFEFFGINRHIPHLVDVSTITFVINVELRNKSDEWFLDFTNPDGESLVSGSYNIISYSLHLNDARVEHEDLPLLYHILRRREYDWRFYENNNTSHVEIINFLNSWSKGTKTDQRLLSICFELGLIRMGQLTLSGKSLIGGCRRNQRYEYTTP